jgi:hypothetical protein
MIMKTLRWSHLRLVAIEESCGILSQVKEKLSIIKLGTPSLSTSPGPYWVQLNLTPLDRTTGQQHLMKNKTSMVQPLGCLLAQDAPLNSN